MSARLVSFDATKYRTNSTYNADNTIVKIVLQKNPLFSQTQVEELLGQPVVRAFSNEYLAVNHAVEEGKLLDSTSELGQSFAEFAAQLIDQPEVKHAASKRRFLDFFRPAPTLATPGRD